MRWQSQDPNPDLDPHRAKLQDLGPDPRQDQCRYEALKKGYLGCKKVDESGERKCLKEGGRADLKREREAVVAEVSLTGQQVQTEESTKKRAANQAFN